MTNDLSYIAIDFETANTYQNSACSIGLVRFINGIEQDSVHSLIKPAKMYFIKEWTEQIHHISYKDVQDKPYFNQVWESLIEPFINQSPSLPFVAHNASFDMGVIKGCCTHYNMPIPNLKYFDSLKIARKTWLELKSHRLTFLGNYFNIEYEAHDALEDARTCGKLIKIAAENWGVSDIESLLNCCNLSLKSLEEL